MLTHERNKNPATKRGCLACYQTGATAKPYGYITLTFLPMYVKAKDEAEAKLLQVQKEVGLCYKHTTEFCDQKIGPWRKTQFGLIPVRDGNYVLRTEPKDVKSPYSSKDDPKTYRSAAPGNNWKVPKWW
jgi:hypothetical protein